MIVIPAIDLHKGRVVRLRRGDFNDVSVYSDDPAGVAMSFEEAGAGRIHVVDLDATLTGRIVNLDAIRAIRSAAGIEVELGGGIRGRDDALRAFDLGVDYVILGTVTTEDPEAALGLMETFPGRIAVGIDALGGRVAVKGWQELTEKTALEVARYYEPHGPAFIVYTDIFKDGMLTGPNIEAAASLARTLSTPVIASGGVGSIEDIRSLAATGVIHGVITGRAIYEGRLDVRQAVLAASPDDAA